MNGPLPVNQRSLPGTLNEGELVAPLSHRGTWAACFSSMPLLIRSPHCTERHLTHFPVELPPVSPSIPTQPLGCQELGLVTTVTAQIRGIRDDSAEAVEAGHPPPTDRNGATPGGW
jgi:hypothetical protein